MQPRLNTRILEPAVAAEERQEECSRDLTHPATTESLHAYEQSIEAEIDVLIQQFAVDRSNRGAHSEKTLEGHGLKLFDSPGAQLLIGELVGQGEPRDLRPYPVDLPSDPSLFAHQGDSLNVAGHVRKSYNDCCNFCLQVSGRGCRITMRRVDHMFETVLPETFAKRSRRLFYETLPLSLAIHGVAVASAVGISIWEVVLPDQPPPLVRSYLLIAPPPLPPPPPPPPRAVATVKRVVLPPPDVAPAIIPETIPIVERLPLPVPLPAALTSETATESGVPEGVANGVAGGEVGGTPEGVPASVLDPERVYVARTKPLPLSALAQEYPSYPPEARRKRWQDSLVVRYIIGKNGKVIEVTVIEPPVREVFADETLKAIRHWRFRPMIKDGEAREVVHELRVNFQLIYTSG